jgi:hypothetical protein
MVDVRDLFAPDRKVVDHHTVAPMEASFVAQAEQRRLSLAEPVAEQLAGLRSRVNKLDNAIESEARELNAAHERVNAHDQRRYEPEFATRTYWLSMLLLVAIEIPLNAAALDFARLAVWETFVVAAGFGLLNFFGAKAVARVVRQKGWSDRAWRDWSIAACVVIALGFALVQFAQLRQLDPVLGGSARAFLALQVTFFVTVAAVTYFHIDSDAEREQLHRRIASGKRRLNADWQQRAGLAKQYNARRARIELALDAIIHDTHDRIAQYRCGNLLRRPDAGPVWMSRAIPHGVFRAIELPPLIDEEPKAIREIISSTWSRKETD